MQHCSNASKRTTTNFDMPHGNNNEQNASRFRHKCSLFIVGEGKQLLPLPEKKSMGTSKYDSLEDERAIVLKFYKEEGDIGLSLDESEDL